MAEKTIKNSAQKAAKMAQAVKSVDQWLDVLEKTLDGFEAENPHWRVMALLWLMEGGCRSLRHYIESPDETQISWSSPIVELHYPVRWNWDLNDQSEFQQLQISYGELSSAQTARKSTAIKAIAQIAAEAITQTALREFTNDVALEKRGNHWTPLLSLEAGEWLEGIRGAKARQKALDELYQPFSVGVAEIDWSDSDLREGKPLSASARKKLAQGEARMAHPGFQFTIRKGKHTLALSLFFQASQLIVEPRRKRAYYPLTIGFMLTPQDDAGRSDPELMDAPWANPANWSTRDQRSFWRQLSAAFRTLAESLKPEAPTEIQKALLTVQVKLEVPVDANNASSTHAMVARMREQFEAEGLVREMSHAWSPAPAATKVADLDDLLRQTADAKTAATKGKTLEALVRALLQTVSEFDVKANVPTKTEEIDLVVLNANDDPRWKSSPPLILVECKNWSEPSGKNQLVDFRAKMVNRRGQCRLGLFVSWNGFASTFTMELLRDSKEDVVVVPLGGEDLRRAVAAGSLLPVLQAAWDRWVMT